MISHFHFVKSNDTGTFKIQKNIHNLFDLLLKSFMFDDNPLERNFISILTLVDIIKDKNFSIISANKMLSDLYLQIDFLHSSGYSISYFQPNDITIFDNNIFRFTNFEKLYPIDKSNQTIYITDTYDLTSSFLSPEMKINSSIPSSIHYSCCYYSIALIVLFSLKNCNLQFNNLSNLQIMNYYKHTKLYLTLSYCMEKDPSQRLFLIF